MKLKKLAQGALVATAVAGLMATTIGCGGGGSTELVKCSGLHDCKGKGACKGVKTDGTAHDCAGQNDCKGSAQFLTADECTKKGGKNDGPAPKS